MEEVLEMIKGTGSIVGFEGRILMYQPLEQLYNPKRKNCFPQPPGGNPRIYQVLGNKPWGNLNSKLRPAKLALKSIDENIMNWMEFRDSVERNVHLNSSLCDVDKMCYLEASLLVMPLQSGALLEIIMSLQCIDLRKLMYLMSCRLIALKAVVGVS